MTKEEIKIFEDIADSLRTIASALAYNPNTEVMSATESLSLIEKHLDSVADDVEKIQYNLDNMD